MKKRKTYVFTIKIHLFALTVLALLQIQPAYADPPQRQWKKVTMGQGIEVSHRCSDADIPNASHSQTCSWWFRNTTDRPARLMYMIRGDGYTVKQNLRVTEGIIVGRTDLDLPPYYEQPNIDCTSGQCLIAYSIKDVRALSVRFIQPNEDESPPASASAQTSPAPISSEARPMQYCLPDTLVMIGTCRCGSSYTTHDYPNTGKRVCIKKQPIVQTTGGATHHQGEDIPNEPPPTTPPKPEPPKPEPPTPLKTIPGLMCEP